MPTKEEWLELRLWALEMRLADIVEARKKSREDLRETRARIATVKRALRKIAKQAC